MSTSRRNKTRSWENDSILYSWKSIFNELVKTESTTAASFLRVTKEKFDILMMNSRIEVDIDWRRDLWKTILENFLNIVRQISILHPASCSSLLQRKLLCDFYWITVNVKWPCHLDYNQSFVQQSTNTISFQRFLLFVTRMIFVGLAEHTY